LGQPQQQKVARVAIGPAPSIKSSIPTTKVAATIVSL